MKCQAALVLGENHAMKRMILAASCVAVICLPVVLWIYGHLEAYCVFYPGIDTYYAAGYSEVAFDQVSTGMTAQAVEALLGKPLHSHTNKEDSVRWCYTGDGKCFWGDFAWLGRELIFRTNRVATVERIIYYD